jgi:hypothetical protein
MSYITDTSTPASKVIHLDSKHAHVYHQKDEDGNEITSNFIYHMNEPVICPDHLSMLCSLHTATIPYSFYNIRNNVNNALVMYYSDQAGTYTGTYKMVFPSGNYNAVSFLNTFLTIMNGDSNLLAAPWAANSYRLYKLGAGGNYSVFPINPFLTSATPYVVQGNFDLVRLRYHIYSSTAVNGILMKWDDPNTTANDLFGFRFDGPQSIPYSATGYSYLASDKVIDMNDEIHGLYLRTSLTTDGTLNAETGIFSNILARIPINCNAGGVIFHTPNNSSHKLQISLPVIKYVGVKLTDEKNRILDLNGLNFQISVQIDFVPRLQTLNGITRKQRRAHLTENQAGADRKLKMKKTLSENKKKKPKI